MTAQTQRVESPWSLPYQTTLPAEPAKRRRRRAIRVIVYCLFAAALIGPVVQFQSGTVRRLRKAERAAEAAAGRPVREQAAMQQAVRKVHKGAIGRWRSAVWAFWEGKNIYGRAGGRNRVRLHPNMPFTVILLSPFAYLPPAVSALAFNVLKIAVIVLTVLMAVRVVDHGSSRMPDWVVALGLLWALKFIVSDIQHGNTNVCVLGAIVLHLWLYRRGQDLAAGASLALAVCLKLTPVLFLAYWVYQRQWKLAAWTVVALVVFAVVVPAAVMGPIHYAALTRDWLNNLILPGLVEGAWYPVHINQSLPGVVSRYFLSGQNGDIFWNPDDQPYATLEKHGFITLLELSETAAKRLLRALQALIVLAGAWAIGWRKLGRDDGRRALHYGLVVLAMLMLNQRTWDHHAAVILVAPLAAWYAIACGRIPRPRRVLAFVLMGVAALNWLTSNEIVEGLARLAGRTEELAKGWSDLVDAYGPSFFAFLAMFMALVVLSVTLRRAADPYADHPIGCKEE